MSSVFESIKQGLTEAIEHAAGQESEAVVHLPRTLDVKSIREQVGMTQTAFAAVFDVSLSTLRRWERGERTPQGPARVLLHLVAHEPQAVLQALEKVR
jgi:putative transcriptional regulator